MLQMWSNFAIFGFFHSCCKPWILSISKSLLMGRRAHVAIIHGRRSLSHFSELSSGKPILKREDFVMRLHRPVFVHSLSGFGIRIHLYNAGLLSCLRYFSLRAKAPLTSNLVKLPSGPCQCVWATIIRLVREPRDGDRFADSCILYCVPSHFSLRSFAL